MGLRELFVALAALLCLGLGLLLLEQPRTGLALSVLDVDGVPAHVAQVPGAVGPVVVLAHGIAGSSQMMDAAQLTLARAGYVAVSYDMRGHGRNDALLSLAEADAVLLAEMRAVVEAAMGLDGADGRLVLVGHGRGGEVAVAAGDGAEAVIALALQDGDVTATRPAHLLILNGQFDRRPRDFARMLMTELQAGEDETVGSPGSDFARRAQVVPLREQFGLAYAPAALSATLDWANARFGRQIDNGTARLGFAIVLTLLGLVLIAQPMAAAWPPGGYVNPVPDGAFWTLLWVPAGLTPLVLWLVETNFMPMLGAGYLALHLAIYGLLMLGGLAVEGDPPRLKGWRAGLGAAGFAVLVFGAVLDRYVMSFALTGDRWFIFAALAPGAVLAMVAEATLIQAGRAGVIRRLAARVGFILSLGLAVLLDPEGLRPLMAILPLFVPFFLCFGLIAGWVGRRSGSALAMGLGLGLPMAWGVAAVMPLMTG